jgi:hypothetical protein
MVRSYMYLMCPSDGTLRMLTQLAFSDRGLEVDNKDSVKPQLITPAD